VLRRVDDSVARRRHVTDSSSDAVSSNTVAPFVPVALGLEFGAHRPIDAATKPMSFLSDDRTEALAPFEPSQTLTDVVSVQLEMS
jgi:hypothetical protein